MIKLEHVQLGNAAGTIKHLSEFTIACRSAMTEITVGSITLEERPGNLGDTYYYHPTEGWSLNSLGLPNPGLTAYLQVLPEMRLRAHAAGKNLRASAAGFSPKEYAILAQQCLESGVDEVELNLGCSNVWGKEGQKPIASYHPELVAAILEEVKNAIHPMKVAVKISPVESPHILALLTEAISKSGIVSRIVATNTIPNQERLREDSTPALNFHNGVSDGNHGGGLAGAPLRNTALSVIYTLRRLLPDHKITGVGGIFTGEDAFEFFKKGVDGVQCATAYIGRGPRLFSDMSEELSGLMD